MEKIKSSVPSTTNLTISHSFKVILSFLSQNEKGKLRLLNSRVSSEHVPYFQNHLRVHTYKIVEPDIIARFLTKSVTYNITSMSVVFDKKTLHYVSEEFNLVSKLLKDKVKSLRIEFIKRSAPDSHHNLIIVDAVQNFSILEELAIIGPIQNNTIELII